jgi:hypothetical protein
MMKADKAREYFASFDQDYVGAPLCWNFMLMEVANDRLGPLTDTLIDMGFPCVKPLADEGIVWFQEVRVHTADSFAARVADVAELAARERLEFWSYGVGGAAEDAEPAAAADGGRDPSS